LPDKPTLDEFIEVQRRFRLREPAHAEKDWYVVKALAAVAATDKGPLKLVSSMSSDTRSITRCARESAVIESEIWTRFPERGLP
jgi:hypothetical protein